MASQASSASLSVAQVAAALLRRQDGPLHLRLEHALRDLIRSGRLPSGALVPGELELAAHLHLSRHTVRHALGVLTSEGLIRRERGRATTVVSNGTSLVIQRSLDAFYAFAWEVRARGAEQRSFVLERTVVRANAGLSATLRLPRDARVVRLVRLRTADGEPLVLETSHLPEPLMRGLDDAALEREPLYDLIERVHDVRVERAHETIRPLSLGRRVARLLGVAPGSAAFCVDRTTWSSHQAPIEWQVSLVRGDRYLYAVDLPRNG
jgi:GntR family transcriptional regulator